ncbi:DUF1045 domain-containing protein [Seohaeicola saemankumensis]|nr:DUF1045 domain-containing protein [Seohaeicola saemankumensis]MCA0871182.1 DUF1045 domain-containing protein [Seohaeicola saemankumensis]
MNFKRFAIYYTPPQDAAWARFATRWLGWDMAAGAAAPHPDIPDLPRPVSEITATPRKYGLHGTIKPPFRLAEAKTAGQLATACATLCAELAPVRLDGLQLARLGRFLALRPMGGEEPLNQLAATCVRDLDSFRAPASEAELARRRAGGLSPAQDSNLTTWGYPYVMQDFRFHITLTGRLPRAELPATEAALHTALDGMTPAPFILDALSLVGEDDNGLFHLIHRYALSG